MKRIFITLIFFTIHLNFYGSEIDAFKAVSTFSQDGSNCASIALIKAAMLRYGYDKVIQYEKNIDIFKVTLRDGTHLEISEIELELVKKLANFNIKKILSENETESVLLQAHLLYACIAKNVQLIGYYGCEQSDGNYYKYKPKKNFNRALRFISRTSICTDKSYLLLGLKIKGSINDFTDPLILNQDGIILYSQSHAVVAYQGKVDCYGEWVPVITNEVCDQKFKWFIVLQ